MTHSENHDEPSKVLLQFIDFVFASILFSCVASFVQSSSIDKDEYKARLKSVESRTPGQLDLDELIRITDEQHPEFPWVSVGDAFTRAAVSISASLYFYLIFRTKVLLEFDGSIVIQWTSLLFAISAAVFGGWYLFWKIEYLAMGPWLIISSVCYAVMARTVISEETRKFFKERTVLHAVVGGILTSIGCLTAMNQDWVLQILTTQGISIVHPILRLVLLLVIWWGIHKLLSNDPIWTIPNWLRRSETVPTRPLTNDSGDDQIAETSEAVEGSKPKGRNRSSKRKDTND